MPPGVGGWWVSCVLHLGLFPSVVGESSQTLASELVHYGFISEVSPAESSTVYTVTGAVYTAIRGRSHNCVRKSAASPSISFPVISGCCAQYMWAESSRRLHHSDMIVMQEGPDDVVSASGSGDEWTYMGHITVGALGALLWSPQYMESHKQLLIIIK